jgi:peroxin-2
LSINRYDLESLIGIFLEGISIFDAGTTYGNLFQNLMLCSGDGKPLKSSQKYLLVCCKVIILFARKITNKIIDTLLQFPSISGNIQNYGLKLISVAECLFKLFSMVNFLVFLHNGRYLTPLNYILNIRATEVQANHYFRQIDLEFVNRELIWKSLTEFYSFAYPYLPSFRYSDKKLDYTNLPQDGCPFCFSSKSVKKIISIPYKIVACSHIGCYRCVASLKQSKEGCPKCGSQIDDIIPV